MKIQQQIKIIHLLDDMIEAISLQQCDNECRALLNKKVLLMKEQMVKIKSQAGIPNKLGR